uniref:Glycine N-acyltransferase-like protein n=1 Tax=Rhabditophanes sp. KR3021 TaxID=114890 RepID=A0AC35TZT2_9BILA
MVKVIQIGPNNYSSYLEEIKDSIELIAVSSSVILESEKKFPDGHNYFFKAVASNGLVVHFVFRVYRHIIPVFAMSSTALEGHIESDLFSMFGEVFKQIEGFHQIQNFIIHGPSYITRIFNKWRVTITGTVEQEYPCCLYYMTPIQMELTLNFKKQLPAGYHLSDDISSADSNFINGTWRHARKGDEQQTAAKFRHLPFACAKTETGHPASFVMTDPSGFLNHLFTLEEDRRKGLGLIVEIECCKKTIREGRIPYKTVEHYNTLSLKASDQSPYYTRWNYPNGEAIDYLFIAFSPNV